MPVDEMDPGVPIASNCVPSSNETLTCQRVCSVHEGAVCVCDLRRETTGRSDGRSTVVVVPARRPAAVKAPRTIFEPSIDRLSSRRHL